MLEVASAAGLKVDRYNCSRVTKRGKNYRAEVMGLILFLLRFISGWPLFPVRAVASWPRTASRRTRWSGGSERWSSGRRVDAIFVSPPTAACAGDLACKTTAMSGSSSGRRCPKLLPELSVVLKRHRWRERTGWNKHIHGALSCFEYYGSSNVAVSPTRINLPRFRKIDAHWSFSDQPNLNWLAPYP